jgi:hypothetical protein
MEHVLVLIAFFFLSTTIISYPRRNIYFSFIMCYCFISGVFQYVSNSSGNEHIEMQPVTLVTTTPMPSPEMVKGNDEMPHPYQDRLPGKASDWELTYIRDQLQWERTKKRYIFFFLVLAMVLTAYLG